MEELSPAKGQTAWNLMWIASSGYDFFRAGLTIKGLPMRRYVEIINMVKSIIEALVAKIDHFQDTLQVQKKFTLIVWRQTIGGKA
jgi:hypothetical protein